VLVPFFATLFGGLVANLLFGIWSIVGFLVTGLGDAVGEPVGVRFGKHHYRVPARRGVPTTRTLEGSLAVFIMCCLAIVLGIRLVSGLWVPATDLGRVALAGFVCTLIEASAPHGWDNALLQVGGAAVVSLFWLGI
ncbi:MAG: hypothetical protein HKN21_03540, partial [Candidatus Eisenbacteria bacterium]|nr:hypothetical protein [Candidatus Eisenbacteria bacterium]